MLGTARQIKRRALTGQYFPHVLDDKIISLLVCDQRAGGGHVVFHSFNFLFSEWALALWLLLQLCQFNTAEWLVRIIRKLSRNVVFYLTYSYARKSAYNIITITDSG